MRSKGGGEASAGLLDLRAFIPYRLAVLAEAVSRLMGEVYSDRFQLTRNEWRVLAALDSLSHATQTEVAEYSTLDKMQVSRAIAALDERGLIARSAGRADRRTKLLVLTQQGRALFETIVPLVLEQQRLLLKDLAADERDALDRALDALLERARRLQTRSAV